MMAGLAVALPGAPAAVAADLPPLPETVSTDVLPAPQVNGVVWDLAVSGNVAYAVGSFTRARPAGTAAGAAGEVVRNNAMAFDITTGAILNWNPNLNAQARAVDVSPDGAQVYVGGEFTTAGGQARSKLAVFTPSGALQPFTTSIGGSVHGISVLAGTVYVSGSFGTAGGSNRSNTAAYNRATGALLPWAPKTDNIVHAVLASPDGRRVVLGGRFQTLNGEPRVGIGAVDGSTGASQAWSSRPVPAKSGKNWSWVTQLIEVNGTVYGAANGDGEHWFDGRFSADFATGDLTWLDNCYGSTSDVAVIGQVMYSVSHAHDCASVGGFPESVPRSWKRGLAETTFATGTDQAPPGSNSNYSGQPVPSLLHWYPAISAGTYTGQFQGGWALAATDRYLVMGGEFTTINGKNQEGLAVFATRNIAPNKTAPVYTPDLKPTVTSDERGTVRVAWPATWDYDDETLTYEVLRDNSLTAIATFRQESIWWKSTPMGHLDVTQAPGTSHTYRIRVKDPWGNEYIGPRSAAVTVSAAVADAYSTLVRQDGAQLYYRLDEDAAVAIDRAGFDDGDRGSGVTKVAQGAVAGNAASAFNGAATASVANRKKAPAPNTFTVEAWFQTSSTGGGYIAGFGSARTGNSGSHDRHLWLDNSGKLWFGAWTGSAATLTSEKSYNDGGWHLATVTFGAGGTVLYVDGAPVAQRPDLTAGQAYDGYWRIGSDSLSGWPGAPTNRGFKGNLDEVAVYPSVLSAATVLTHYKAASGEVEVPVTASFTSTVKGRTVSFDAAGSTPGAVYSWDFGDGGVGTGATVEHAYAAAGSYTATLTVTAGGRTAVKTAQVTVGNTAPQAAFTVQADGLKAAFDANGSADADGPLASYSWDFGDGTTGTGATAVHTYAAAGSYAAVLTVRDSDGATATATRQVTVAAPGAGVYAADTFTRSSANGWMAAETGGEYSYPGSRANFTVADGLGLIRLAGAGSGPSVYLGSVSSVQTEIQAEVGNDVPATGGGIYHHLYLRDIPGSGTYTAKVRYLANGTVNVSLNRDAAFLGRETVVPGLTYRPGDRLTVRAQATGTSPTTLKVKVWKTGTPEPSAWQLTATDSTTALQAPGRVGLGAYLSGSATAVPVFTRWDNLQVGPPKP